MKPVRIEPRFVPPTNSPGSTLPRHLRDGPIRPMGWEPPSDRQIVLRAIGQVAVLVGFFAVVWCAVVMFS